MDFLTQGKRKMSVLHYNENSVLHFYCCYYCETLFSCSVFRPLIDQTSHLELSKNMIVFLQKKLNKTM